MQNNQKMDLNQNKWFSFMIMNMKQLLHLINTKQNKNIQIQKKQILSCILSAFICMSISILFYRQFNFQFLNIEQKLQISQLFWKVKKYKQREMNQQQKQNLKIKNELNYQRKKKRKKNYKINKLKELFQISFLYQKMPQYKINKLFLLKIKFHI
ncbi:transmembrane protein, putative (macronuclear) [Tetrahymena thermophila SB210]|uniref:Transmembrane protein, putative n=1 Tax=Tetrahymena thermophila (strain SB210) TaxID=312017 RepID=W7XL26_TETTS|nr:transmembrane protein, putative [Tetrahymena thermophila SB210]EWS75554.1 transmembrane protein, putative [Tetrahymena thermophila SB210]|eukprot:XP_012651920.1 transmembrane protein, putative [Tetrahymena thermophila SB210]